MKKICRSCLGEKSTDEFYKQPKGKYGVNSICKVCSRRESKVYREDPKNKERHTEAARKWREENRDRMREINARCLAKNKDRFNSERRERLKTDPEYRAKVRARGVRYKESGRRNEMNRLNPKHRARARKWQKDHPKEVLQKMRDYRKKKWNALEKEQRDTLADQYIVKILKKQVKHQLKSGEIPKDLIQIKKQTLKLKRQLNQKPNDSKNSTNV